MMLAVKPAGRRLEEKLSLPVQYSRYKLGIRPISKLCTLEETNQQALESAKKLHSFYCWVSVQCSRYKQQGRPLPQNQKWGHPEIVHPRASQPALQTSRKVSQYSLVLTVQPCPYSAALSLHYSQYSLVNTKSEVWHNFAYILSCVDQILLDVGNSNVLQGFS